jgi:hypothetical protein
MGEDGYIRSWNADQILFVEVSYDGQVFQIEPVQEICVNKHARLVSMVGLGTRSKRDEHDWW